MLDWPASEGDMFFCDECASSRRTQLSVRLNGAPQNRDQLRLGDGKLAEGLRNMPPLDVCR